MYEKHEGTRLTFSVRLTMGKRLTFSKLCTFRKLRTFRKRLTSVCEMLDIQHFYVDRFPALTWERWIVGVSYDMGQRMTRGMS